MKEEEEKNKILEYFYKRFHPETGGFSKVPRLPATVEDTYFSLKTLLLLNPSFISLNKNKIVNFLTSESFDFLNTAEVIYRYFKCYEYLQTRIPEKIEERIKTGLKKFKGKSLAKFSFKDFCFLYYLKTKLRSGTEDLKKILEKRKNRAVSVEDFYYLGKIFPEIYKNCRERILRSQNSDGGFGFYPGTTSFMENTYYAVKILIVLNVKPVFLKELKEFILLCRNADGGFARKPGGISFPESTSQSVWLLHTLAYKKWI